MWLCLFTETDSVLNSGEKLLFTKVATTESLTLIIMAVLLLQKEYISHKGLRLKDMPSWEWL